MSHDAASQELSVGDHASAVISLTTEWAEAGFCDRLWAADHTLWLSEPGPEITDRLGWLDLPLTMRDETSAFVSFASEVREAGFTDVVVLGMGGSSLAPEVFAATFPGPTRLHVLDSTHPSAVAHLVRQADIATTLFVVASKSGTTIEPLSFFKFFWDEAGGNGSQFVAITDPGTPLADLAGTHDFRRTFEANPDVGGRYSALADFGLVPAALRGVPISELLDSASAIREDALRCEGGPLALGATLAILATHGRDKATFLCSPSLAAFPAWVEQLIAESTGKSGTGIIPIAGEPVAAPDLYGDDRVFIYLAVAGDDDSEQSEAVDRLDEDGHPVVRISLPDRAALGGEMYRAEFAVAAASAGLGIHPFNQPNVQAAKELARRAMDGADLGEAVILETAEAAEAIEHLLETTVAGDYVALLAFLEPTPQMSALLERLRLAIRDRTQLATTAGYGPRYLHSTGQLHKGGPGTGVFVIFVDSPHADVAVPGETFSFGDLIAAQARGDHLALLEAGRRVIRIQLGAHPDNALASIITSLP